MNETVEERLHEIRNIAEPMLKVSGMAIESLIEARQSVGGDLFVLFVLTTREKVACIYIDFKAKIVYKGRCYDEHILSTLPAGSVTEEDKALTSGDDMAMDDVMFSLKNHFFKRH